MQARSLPGRTELAEQLNLGQNLSSKLPLLSVLASSEKKGVGAAREVSGDQRNMSHV